MQLMSRTVTKARELSKVQGSRPSQDASLIGLGRGECQQLMLPIAFEGGPNAIIPNERRALTASPVRVQMPTSGGRPGSGSPLPRRYATLERIDQLDL